MGRVGALGRRVPSPPTEMVVGRLSISSPYPEQKGCGKDNLPWSERVMGQVPHPGQRGMWEGFFPWGSVGEVFHSEQRRAVGRSPDLVRGGLW